MLHDRNGDEKVSFNWPGISKEGDGFSNNPDKTFRKPTFEEAKVQILETVKDWHRITIDEDKQGWVPVDAVEKI